MKRNEKATRTTEAMIEEGRGSARERERAIEREGGGGERQARGRDRHRYTHTEGEEKRLWQGEARDVAERLTQGQSTECEPPYSVRTRTGSPTQPLHTAACGHTA